jgi:signal transduction histidine kinase
MAVKGARDFIMQYPTSQQIQPVLDATRQVLRLQASSSLHQAIADSAVALFEAAGAALFLVDRDRAALTAVSGSWAGLDPGASHTTAAILEPEVPVLVVPIRDSRGVVVAALWIRTASSEVKAPDGGLALELFAVQTAAALENARAYERLIRVDSKRQDDIATLAHELRNPLGAIVNALAVLDRLGAPDARILQLRALIRRQTTHLAKLIGTCSTWRACVTASFASSASPSICGTSCASWSIPSAPRAARVIMTFDTTLEANLLSWAAIPLASNKSCAISSTTP